MDKNTIDLSTVSENYFYKHNTLPKYLTKLIVPRSFDGPIQVPKYLCYLLLGEQFNHLIVLSKYMEKFLMSYAFDRPIVLSKSITHFKMSYFFNQPVKISKKTKELMFGREFNQPILLTKNIRKLCISVMYVRKLNIEHLDLLIIDAVANYHIVDGISDTVKNVVFGDFMDLPLNNLPCEANVQIDNIYYKHKVAHDKMCKNICTHICEFSKH